MGFLDPFSRKQLHAVAGNNNDESCETEPKQYVMGGKNQNNELEDDGDGELQSWLIILYGFVTTSNRFHITHSNLISCYCYCRSSEIPFCSSFRSFTVMYTLSE